MELSSKKRANLRSHAHHLKPVVVIGRDGLTSGALKSINNALNSHELIKVKAKDCDHTSISEMVMNKTGCVTIGSIGNIIIFFKQIYDREKSKFIL